MRKSILISLMVVASVLLISNFSWGQCPEDPNDMGNCDTLHVIPYGADLDSIPPFVLVDSLPAFVEVLLLVTHDVPEATRYSLAGMVVPLAYSHTNPAKYCSISAYWNNTDALSFYPGFSTRSIFRYIVEGTDTIYHNRMADMGADLMGREWVTRLLMLASDSSWFYHSAGDSLFAPPRFWLSMVSDGPANQCWWEGDTVLLATITFRVEDTMTVCLDSTFWPPTARLRFTRDDAVTFIPRQNMPVCFRVGTAGNSVREIHGSDDSRPSEFSLSQNYPNPFNPVTNIEFNLPRAAYVKLDVFNIVGQRVRTLVDEEMEPGRYVADWDGKDKKGNLVSSGIYFYRMDAGDFLDMKKMLLVK